MPLSIFDESAPYWRTIEFDDTGAPGDYYLVSGLLNSVRVDQVLVSTSDPAGLNCYLLFTQQFGDATHVCTVAVPPGAGVTPGVPPVDLLDAAVGLLINCVVPPVGNLYINFPDALTPGSRVGVVAVGGFV